MRHSRVVGSRYKPTPVGWRKDSYRHYLAAKGIRTRLFAPRMNYYASRASPYVPMEADIGERTYGVSLGAKVIPVPFEEMTREEREVVAVPKTSEYAMEGALEQVGTPIDEYNELIEDVRGAKRIREQIAKESGLTEEQEAVERLKGMTLAKINEGGVESLGWEGLRGLTGELSVRQAKIDELKERPDYKAAMDREAELRSKATEMLRERELWNPDVRRVIERDVAREIALSNPEVKFFAKKKQGFLGNLFGKGVKKSSLKNEFRNYKPAKGRRVVENIHDGITFVENGRRYSVSPDYDTIADGAKGREMRPAELKFVRGAPLFVLKKHYGDSFERVV